MPLRFRRVPVFVPVGGALLAAGAVLVASLYGCGKNALPLEPLSPAPTTAGVVVTGMVLLQNSSPAAGVEVVLDPMQNGAPSAVRALAEALAARRTAPGANAARTTATLSANSRATTTDAAGRYVFSGVSDGAYLVTGMARHYQSGYQHVFVQATAGDTTYVNIHLLPTGTFSGVATLEGETNHADILVSVPGTSYEAVTDAAGNYVMTDVPIGLHTLTGQHVRFLDGSTSGSLAAAGDSVAVPPMTLKLDRNIGPVASASVSQATTCTLDPVGLNGSGTDADGTIVRYDWDFDDDGTTDYSSPSSGVTTHAYAAGAHRARLTVRDNSGAYAFAVVNFTTTASDTFFVSASTGSPGGTGTSLSPFKTIAQGIAAAAAVPAGGCTPVVLVSNDTYSETPAFAGRMRVLGGYSPLTWTRTAGSYSIVNVGTSPATASNISAATQISGLDLRASAASVGNSIALYSANSTASLAFVDCKFTAGKGANGVAGGNGAAGTAASGGLPNSASNGGQGGNGGLPGGASGAMGGAGALAAGSPTLAGSPGGTTGCGAAAAGGAGGATLCGSGNNGQNGLPGCSVTQGANGSAATAGSASGGVWTTGTGLAGTNGTAGFGGQGGGGASNTATIPPNCTGAAGGGGAGGGGNGGYGTAGGAGGGGGASFAVFLYNSSPSFSACSFTSANGGAGGNGGNGGAGGAGGAGGIGGPGPNGFKGGNGGAGLEGGAGGGGSGGAGGPSAALALEGSSSPALSSPSYLIGVAGTGGTGGIQGKTLVAAPSGPNGSASNTINLGP